MIMARRKNAKGRDASRKEDKELKALYAEYKRNFSAADLQKYTEIEEGIPLEQVIKEMEQIHRKFKEKQAKRKRA
jgi:hypothetical protein